MLNRIIHIASVVGFFPFFVFAISASTASIMLDVGVVVGTRGTAAATAVTVALLYYFDTFNSSFSKVYRSIPIPLRYDLHSIVISLIPVSILS